MPINSNERTIQDHGDAAFCAHGAQAGLTPLAEGEIGRNVPIAFVYRPARNALQSGPRTRKWVLQLEPQRPLEIEPLMGWTSGNDPARHIRLGFPTREAAVDFARAQGWQVYVLPDNDRSPVIKSYRDKTVSKPLSERKPTEPVIKDLGKRRSTSATSAEQELTRSSAVSLNDMLEKTFPASDPLPLWSGRIGPPRHESGASA